MTNQDSHYDSTECTSISCNRGKNNKKTLFSFDNIFLLSLVAIYFFGLFFYLYDSEQFVRVTMFLDGMDREQHPVFWKYGNSIALMMLLIQPLIIFVWHIGSPIQKITIFLMLVLLLVVPNYFLLMHFIK